jgi:hypothetical protein
VLLAGLTEPGEVLALYRLKISIKDSLISPINEQCIYLLPVCKGQLLIKATFSGFLGWLYIQV